MKDNSKIEQFRNNGWLSDEAYKELMKIKERLDNAEDESKKELEMLKSQIDFKFI